MVRITLDTWIIGRASMITNSDDEKLLKNNCLKILHQIYGNNHKIVLDKYDMKICKEYTFRANGYAEEWVLLMTLNKKKFYKIDIRKKKLPKKIIKDSDDAKFLLVCLYSGDKKLILGNGDSHYTNSSCQHFMLKNDIECYDVTNALELTK